MTVRVLVLGASGMLGNAVLRLFARTEGFEVWGSTRSEGSARLLPGKLRDRLITGVDVEQADHLVHALETAAPAVVINCVGVVKQIAAAEDPLQALPINALLPHRLARIAKVAGARLIHVSTDCVFAGTKGMYRESDVGDATDLYGRSKHLGEVDYPNAITLRTSIIGHELGTAHGLLGWFLAQSGGVKGFTRAVFSGLPTVELAKVMRDHVIPSPALRGVYHVSAAPISKYDLLKLIAAEYGRSNTITPDDKLVIDRSLDSTRFRAATNYAPPAWPELIRLMHEFK